MVIGTGLPVSALGTATPEAGGLEPLAQKRRDLPPTRTHFQGWKCVRVVQPSAHIGHVHALPKVNVSLPKQTHDLLCTASLPHPRTLSSPCWGMWILSQDLDQDLGRGSPAGSVARQWLVVPLTVRGGDQGSAGLWGLGAVAALALAFSLRGSGFGRAGEQRHAGAPRPRDLLVLLLPPLMIFAAMSSKTGFSEHFRYVLPCFPFPFVGIAAVFGNFLLTTLVVFRYIEPDFAAQGFNEPLVRVS